MRNSAVWPCLLLALGASAWAEDDSARAPSTVRGITLSTHLDGRDWAWDSVRPSLERIRKTGANWIAIHPYAAIGADGSVRFAEFASHDPPEHVTRPIREAHALGLKILIKPHLAYWGSPFDWRGEIAFTSEAQWDRFWSDYRRWITAVAAAAREADGFVVGTELSRTLGNERAWREIIAAVRAVTDVPLTYAANWDSYERVPFWDALDTIGIQAYFPLTDDGDTGERAIRAGWRSWMSRLAGFSRRHGRSIVFTELGYNHAHAAPVRPWDHRVDGEEARSVQQTCLRAALAAVEAEPTVIGAFLWKWFPEPRPLGRNFQLATPPIVGVIHEAWRETAKGPE